MTVHPSRFSQIELSSSLWYTGNYTGQPSGSAFCGSFGTLLFLMRTGVFVINECVYNQKVFS